MRIGSLFSGIGGLESGLAIAGGPIRVEWRSEITPELEYWAALRFPGIPNLGDITEIDELPPVEMITAGFPCQPVSYAGARKGVNDDRWLFDDIVRLVGRMEPRPWLFFENVPGLLASKDPEPFRRVLFGLASLGYVGRYGFVVAADVGAPHRRKRWFCVARPADADPARWDGWTGWQSRWGSQSSDGGEVPRYADDIGGEGGNATEFPWEEGFETGSLGLPGARPELEVIDGGVDADADRLGREGGESGASGDPGRRAGVRSDDGDSDEATPDPGSGELQRRGGLRVVGGETAEESRERDQWQRSGHPSLGGGTNVSDADGERLEERGISHGDEDEPADLHDDSSRSYWFGPYWPAIDRWERVLGRECPVTPLDEKGRLSEEFVEFIMGYEHRWISGQVSRRHALKALGNAVVPQQAAAAWHMFYA